MPSNPYSIPPDRLMKMIGYNQQDLERVLALFNARYSYLKGLRNMPKVVTRSDDLYVVIETLNDRNAAVARVEFDDYVATGSSKREPGDRFDPMLGETFAIARALIALGEEMEEDAQREVNRRCNG